MNTRTAADLRVLVHRFLTDYRRNGANLLVLIVVPVVFVLVAAGPMTEAAKLLGGSGQSVGTATAGWAAGFLSASAMYFQIRSSRAADRRLALAGLPSTTLMAARLITGLVLALVAAAAGLIALALRTGIDAPMRAIVGTVLFALIYLGIGALAGVLVRNPVNATVLILFVWIIDVFFGPALGTPDRAATRAFPTHFLTLWMTDLPSRHGGRLGDLGWALVWTVAALMTAFVVVTRTSTVRRARGMHLAPGSFADQVVWGVRIGVRDYRRNPVLWALLIAVPAVFIWLSKVVTPAQPISLLLVEDGKAVNPQFWLPTVHAGTMTPIAIASLATLSGMFIVLDAQAGDRRLALAGYRLGAQLTTRLGVIALSVLTSTGAALIVTALLFDAQQWTVFIAANLLVAAIYALIGVCIGPLFGRVSGVLIAFLIPFLDLGISQSPMLRPEPPTWAHGLPGYGPYRVLLDGGLSRQFDTVGPLAVGLAWLIGLLCLSVWVFRSTANQSRPNLLRL